jgi:hypothetical protein
MDGHGNAYLPGITSYQKILSTLFNACQMNSGGIGIWTAGGAGGPWSLIQQIAIQADEVGLMIGNVNTGNNIVVGEAAFGLEVQGGAEIISGFGGLTSDKIALLASLAGSSLLTVTNTHAGATVSGISCVMQAAGDQYMGFKIAGDTNNRIVFGRQASGASIELGGGTGAPDVTLNRPSANLLRINNADTAISTIGRGLQVAEGANAKQGTAKLTAGTVTVATTAVTANSRIFLTTQDNAFVGTLGFHQVSARVAGASFTITSSSVTDTSTDAWEIIEPA